MPLAAKPIPAGEVGVDTIFRFDPQSAARLAKATVLGRSVAFVWRYVGLNGPSPYDITEEEAQAITGAGLALLLVQHAHGPDGHPWVADGFQGQRDAVAACLCAKTAGYAPGCSLAFDLEDCKSVGQPVIDHVTVWASIVRTAGWSPTLYVGYCAGLTPAQLAALPFDAYWSDAGPRSVAPKSFACKQHLQTTTVGIGIDPDEVLGPGLVGMIDADAYVDVADRVAA